MSMSRFPKLVTDELYRARGLHGPILSLHDGLGKIREEYCEFEDEVFVKNPIGPNIIKELTHLAAMCQRLVEDLGLLNSPFKSATAYSRTPVRNYQELSIDTPIENGKAQLIILVSCFNCGYADWMSQPIMVDDRAEYLSGLAKAALNGWFIGANAERCLCPECAKGIAK